MPTQTYREALEEVFDNIESGQIRDAEYLARVLRGVFQTHNIDATAYHEALSVVSLCMVEFLPTGDEIAILWAPGMMFGFWDIDWTRENFVNALAAFDR